MPEVTIFWDRGRAQVQLLGGMVTPVLTLPDGREIAPLVTAPWGDDDTADHDALPGLMKRLRGEWPCVPFGAPDAPADLPSRWRPAKPSLVGEDFHGFGAHHDWTVTGQEDGAVSLAIDYPADHPIARLERRIAGVAGAPAIEISLTIHARRAVAAPIALHPVFRLPIEPGAADLNPGPFAEARSFPLPVEPGVSRLRPDAVFATLEKAPAKGGPLALNRLPLPVDTEELVQLCGTLGRVELTNHAEAYRATLDYDAEVFPSTLLWLSNRGRSAYPWNGRFLGLGIEPLRGAFDLGPDVGCAPDNPIARAGHATALDLSPDTPFTTTYRIGIAEI